MGCADPRHGEGHPTSALLWSHSTMECILTCETPMTRNNDRRQDKRRDKVASGFEKVLACSYTALQ